MSAARVLFDLQRAGFRLSASDGKLNLDGPVHLLDSGDKAMIQRHKAALIRYCSPSPTTGLSRAMAALGLDMESRADFIFQFHERAAVREFDGGLSRSEAETLASADVLAEVRQLDEQLSQTTANRNDSGASFDGGMTQNTPGTPKRPRIDARGHSDEMAGSEAA